MSKINHNKHIELIQSELIFQTNEFNKLLKKQAAKMFIDNQLFLCRYLGYDEKRGNLLVKFDHRICYPPRKNEHLQCFVSSVQDDNVKNWGGLTYQNLRTNVAAQFESKTVFAKYDPDSTVVGLSGVKVEDVSKFERNALVFLAPTDPPLQYLMNLLDYLKSISPNENEILDLFIDKPNWNPKPLIVDQHIVAKIQADLIDKEIILIQGPPGTGKTYLMALLCSTLLKTDYKILVTALTNRALIELAEKEHLKEALENGQVYKTALSADESKNEKVKGLKSFKSLSQQQPQMLLSSYYTMSQIASIVLEDVYFDYIIIEEASQAFLSTIAISRKLGKKTIVIGDIMQLEPIFHKEFPEEDVNNYHYMVRGLKALSYFHDNSIQYILTDSYRLLPSAVDATNSFYNGVLKSKSRIILPLDFSRYPILKNVFNSYGGTTIVLFDLPSSKSPSIEASQLIINVLNNLKQYDKHAEIAVLSFYRDSVRILQQEVFSQCQTTDGILIDTIDRVQGLTTDFCIFFIPTEAIPFSIQTNRFNVATSRAKLCTLIVSDYSIKQFTQNSPDLTEYFKYIKTIDHT
jgi:archaellum biogenesis ATPase FlaH